MDLKTKLKETIAYLQPFFTTKIDAGIILGTGLGQLVDEIDIVETIEYRDIPHFPVSTVESHSGRLIYGKLKGKTVLVMQGRFHYYEGYDMSEVTYPVRMMKLLGINNLFISNISGGINPDYQIGDVMVLSDHINLLPEHPLNGKNENDWGPRFPDMLGTYDEEWINKALEIGRKNEYRMHKGVYVSVQGPCLETPAEYAMLRYMGADSVGMSTVPEVIVARHMSMRIFAISIISDLGTPEGIKPADINEIIKVANEQQPKLTHIVGELVQCV
ncbi:MAG: purine-nucleoside phosphorylase [Chitinophagales bacterium]